MIGVKQLYPAITESYYWSFYVKNCNPEARRNIAKTLIPGNSSPEVHWQYPTRTILTAQWNDTHKQGLETARILYSFEPTLTYYMGQSVLKLTGITAPEIKNLQKGGELPWNGFSIDTGIITENTYPEYGFRRTPKKYLPHDVDSNGTFLDYQISLPVAAGPSIDVSGDGKVEINQPFKDYTDFIAYTGRVCLDANTELYSRTRQTQVGNLAFGNGRSFGIVYDLLKITAGPQHEAFQELFTRNEVSPSQPLVGLTHLAN